MAKVKYNAPKGYGDVTAYLRVGDASAAIDFYVAAFGAKERYRLMMGRAVGHAELDFGGSRIMLSDEFPDMAILGPKALGNTTCSFALYVDDADAVFQRAVEAGAKVRRPLINEFYGDRTGQIEDPFGHVWMIQQRLEDVKPKEMQKRLDAMMAAGAYEAENAKPKFKAQVRDKAKAKAKAKE
jgi:PhnB protein